MMNDRRGKLHALLSQLPPCAVLLLVTACAAPPLSRPTPPATPVAVPAVKTVPSSTDPAPPAAPGSTSGATFRAVSFSELPGWTLDNVQESWAALLASCVSLGTREPWSATCASARRLGIPGTDVARLFFEQHFTPYQIASSEGGSQGLITGYYEPMLQGSRKPSAKYRHAVYGVPEDLIVVELADVHPELRNVRVRGRIEGRKLMPYPDRAQIESGQAPRGREIVWVDDAIDLFFLQIQGSGRIVLDSGETIRVGYADQNGRPYRSIGRVLVDRGDLPLEQASMQGIKAWARRNPEQLNDLLNSNPSYVFFRELPARLNGPLGALGVPLTAGRSIAIDPRHVPLGAPVFVATTWPNSPKPLNRLMLAQDTGGAIRGAVRADFFWGYGDAAGREAGRMKQALRMWVLLPHGYPVPGGVAHQ